MQDRDVEREIEMKGLNVAPRVTLEEVEAAVVDTTVTLLPNNRTTVVQLTLDNGFTVEGSSAAVSVENFDAELGAKIAKARAMDEVWKLLGFRLADKLQAARNRQGGGGGDHHARYRDAVTGYYVSKEYALANPGSTVQETD